MFKQGIQYERFYEPQLELRDCRDWLCIATMAATVFLPISLVFWLS